MEQLRIHLGDDLRFDQVVKSGLPCDCELLVITKDRGTEEGNPVVALAFGVQLPSGEIRTAKSSPPRSCL